MSDAGRAYLTSLIRLVPTAVHVEHVYELVLTGGPAAFPPLLTWDVAPHILQEQIMPFISPIA